jgi:hypothetical protein
MEVMILFVRDTGERLVVYSGICFIETRLVSVRIAASLASSIEDIFAKILSSSSR